MFLGYSSDRSQDEHLGGRVLDYALHQSPFIFSQLSSDSIGCNVSSFLDRAYYPKVIFIWIVYPPTVHICTRVFLTHWYPVIKSNWFCFLLQRHIKNKAQASVLNASSGSIFSQVRCQVKKNNCATFLFKPLWFTIRLNHQWLPLASQGH